MLPAPSQQLRGTAHAPPGGLRQRSFPALPNNHRENDAGIPNLKKARLLVFLKSGQSISSASPRRPQSKRLPVVPRAGSGHGMPAETALFSIKYAACLTKLEGEESESRTRATLVGAQGCWRTRKNEGTPVIVQELPQNSGAPVANPFGFNPLLTVRSRAALTRLSRREFRRAIEIRALCRSYRRGSSSSCLCFSKNLRHPRTRMEP